jgi:hypothetical protein
MEKCRQSKRAGAEAGSTYNDQYCCQRRFSRRHSGHSRAIPPKSRTIIPVANKYRDVTIPPLAHDLIIAEIESEIALGCLRYTIAVLADNSDMKNNIMKLQVDSHRDALLLMRGYTES